MKKLINRHREAIIKHTNLDLDRIDKITTLYEFDREVQYVLSLTWPKIYFNPINVAAVCIIRPPS